jgi:nitronate monooxygenase
VAGSQDADLCVSGCEAGRHRGLFHSDDLDAQPKLMALPPQAPDTVRVAVRAARGVGDGRGVAAAFALGAAAAQIGTANLRPDQAKTSALHRLARDDVTPLRNLFNGRPARADWRTAT